MKSRKLVRTAFAQVVLEATEHTLSREVLRRRAAMLAAARARWPRSGLLALLHGHAYWGLGDVAKAIQAYREAASLLMNPAEAWINIGDVYRYEGRWKAALNAYLRAERAQSLAKSPESDAWEAVARGRALVHLEVAEPQLAIIDLLLGLQRVPMSTSLTQTLVSACESLVGSRRKQGRAGSKALRR